VGVQAPAARAPPAPPARPPMPHLQRVLAEKASVDLRPFADNARKKIAAAIDDLRKSEDGVRVTAEITSLKLADIAFDSKTLRVIAESEGTINVFISALPAL
jgi:hypothetical protein